MIFRFYLDIAVLDLESQKTHIHSTAVFGRTFTRHSMSSFFDTAQGITTLGAFVGAGIFAAGAFGPAVLRRVANSSILKDKAADRRTLAMQTVLALDDFVGACYAAVHDIPEFNPSDVEEFSFHEPDPVLILPKDGAWSLFDTELADQVLWLSNREKNLSRALDTIDLSEPAYGGFFERRQEGYARLAASALDLIARLLNEFDLTMPEKPDYYKQAEGFAEILRKVETGRSRTTAKVAAVETGSNVTQLFPVA